MKRLLLKTDVIPRTELLGFLIHTNIPYHAPYVLENDYCVLEFRKISDIIEFLDWAEGKRIPSCERNWPKKADRHLGCPAWPNCSEDPNGCAVGNKNYEHYGYRE